MTITKNKIRKRKINLIIPKKCDQNLIILNYSNLGFNLIILKNNDYNFSVPNIWNKSYTLTHIRVIIISIHTCINV